MIFLKKHTHNQYNDQAYENITYVTFIDNPIHENYQILLSA